MAQKRSRSSSISPPFSSVKLMKVELTSPSNVHILPSRQQDANTEDIQQPQPVQQEPSEEQQNSTPKPTSIMQLPQEIIDRVYQRLPNIVAKANFRLTCQKLHRDSEEHMFSRVVISPTLQSIAKVTVNFNRSILNRHGQSIKVPCLAKALVYEDVLPKPLTELYNVNRSHLSQEAKTTYHDYIQEFHQYRQSHQCLGYIMMAASNMPNLERIEWHWGFVDAPEPGTDSNTPLDVMLSEKLSGQALIHRRLYDNRMWADRGSGRILGHPTGANTLHGHNSRRQFHMAVDSALRIPNQSKALTMVIKTGLENVLYAPQPQLQLPANRLKGLEIWYQCNMSDPGDFQMDLSILSNNATGTAQQFRGLRWLTLAGGPIEEREFLNLEMLGDEDNSPEWPDLETIDLKNVQIGFATAVWLKEQRVYLKVHNAIWVEGAREELNKDCVLENIKCSGIQIVVDDDDDIDE